MHGKPRTVHYLAPVPDLDPASPSTKTADSTNNPRRLLLTTEEVAEMLDVDPSTLRRWRTARPIQGPPFIPISGRVTKYRLSDIEAWLDQILVIPGAA